MDVARTLPELREACRRARLGSHDGRLALVPTMGALHAGHLALVRAGRERAGAVAASIFVNPLQFAAGEDLARYPRQEQTDLEALAQAGCALAWLPPVDAMYPPAAATTISVAGPAERWEGAIRPGHFAGVATVVALLFGQVRPDVAVFGEKDWQQLQVVTRMAADLCLGVAVIGVPTVREPDGLALSSRNRFLGPDERARAPALHEALLQARAQLRAGASAGEAESGATDAMRRAGLQPDYVALVEAASLAPIETPIRPARLMAAARLGSVRLLDNIEV